MSRNISLVGGSNNKLKSFATALLGKATNNQVSFSTGSGNNGVAIAEAPADAHTAITRPSEQKPSLYKDVNTVFVRAVLPSATDKLPLRDVVDVYAASGVACDDETNEVKKHFAKTAATAVSLAKQNGNKLTVLVKEVSKHDRINTLFQEAINDVSSGVTVDFVGSAQVANTLIMHPETLGVVATADTPTAENVELLFSGLMGGVSRTYVTNNDSRVFAGDSAHSVASACAEALRAQGLTAEAKKIEGALAKAKGNDDGASILGAL
jgi:hypothetical protein